MKIQSALALSLSLGLLLGIGLWLIAAGFLGRRSSQLLRRVTRGGSTGHRPIGVRAAFKGLLTWLSTVILDSLKGHLKSKGKKQKALYELPDILDLLAVAVAAGDGIYSALARVTPRISGVIADELAVVLRKVNLGQSLDISLNQMADKIGLPQLTELCNKLSLALRRGTPLAELLRSQAETIRGEIKNQLLRAAGRNETRMLIPLIFLILPVTVLFATYPSLQLLQLTI